MSKESKTKTAKLYFGIIFILGLFAAAVAGHEKFIVFLIVFLGLTSYFLPSFIAAMNDNSAVKSIVALNLFAGWSILGWVASLIWALYKPSNQARTIINQRNFASELEDLARLKEKGILTEEEFNSRKLLLLDGR